MTIALTIAKDLLLKPASLDESRIDALLRSMLNNRVDAADLYFQSCSSESWYLEDSEVKSGSYSIDRGVGIRAVSGEKTGYAYCDDILLPAMERAAIAARSIALTGPSTSQRIQIQTSPIVRYRGLNPIEGMSKQDKIAMLQSIDKEARRIDPRVIQVNASLSGSYEVVMVADMHGQMLADVRPMVSVHVSV
ncbi:MAG TPA: metalloprotease TldD, partial [Legionella sp.]|nr:metalloprotease TldD [Legionella sp.]